MKKILLEFLFFGAYFFMFADNFVKIPGGTFLMGNSVPGIWDENDETVHSVKVDSFWCDPFEVKQSDYEKIMGKNPSHFKGRDLPVENVTWFDAVEYCNRLSRAQGLEECYRVSGDVKKGTASVVWNRASNGYRLLTEAEWEYACRAGTTTRYNFGNQVNSELANFEGTYPYSIEDNYVHRTDKTVVPSRARHQTLKTDSLPANGYGLFNMHGNVSEWCFDWYGDYDLKKTENPSGPEKGHLRVNRGGGFNDFGKHLRSSYRSAANPVDEDENTGFRICRNDKPGSGNVTTSYGLNIEVPEKPKILVAYFSYSGNTEQGAKELAEITGGDLFEIRMVTPYRGGIYEASQKDLGAYYKTPLATHVKDFSKYDVILLGYPTWWATLPMPVVTFLEEYDFSGKTVINFSSHGGTIFGESVSALGKKIPKAYVGVGFEWEYSGFKRDKALEWLKRNGVRYISN